MKERVVVLDNIRSCANVGTIFRTAKAFNFDRVLLIGTTPTPIRKEVKKTALGGEVLRWEHYSVNPPWDSLPKPIIALETAGDDLLNQAITLRPFASGTLILGSERGGITARWFDYCDYRLSIGHDRSVINSLNVASAFAIAAANLTQPTK